MASPGAAIQAFCEPVTTTSRPQASMLERHRAEADTPSTRMSASGAPRGRARPARAIGFVTPVDVSLWVSRTAR